MNEVPAKQALQAHFRAQSLSAAQLARLEALAAAGDAAGTDASERSASRGRARIPTWAVLSVVASTAVLALVVFQFWHAHTLSDRIASQVARNHLQLKPADIESSSWREIGDFLRHLDFRLVRSGRLDAAQWRLEGARYCEILDTTAAQLRVVYRSSSTNGADGTVQTLYQVPHEQGWLSSLPEVERGEAPLEVTKSGLRIRIWLEQGILFAMTVPG